MKRPVLLSNGTLDDEESPRVLSDGKLIERLVLLLGRDDVVGSLEGVLTESRSIKGEQGQRMWTDVGAMRKRKTNLGIEVVVVELGGLDALNGEAGELEGALEIGVRVSVDEGETDGSLLGVLGSDDDADGVNVGGLEEVLRPGGVVGTGAGGREERGEQSISIVVNL
jgi:hypothetical protein